MMSPESEVLAQKTPQIFLYSKFFEGEQKCTVFVCPFKCKWATALYRGRSFKSLCHFYLKHTCTEHFKNF